MKWGIPLCSLGSIGLSNQSLSSTAPMQASQQVFLASPGSHPTRRTFPVFFAVVWDLAAAGRIFTFPREMSKDRGGQEAKRQHGKGRERIGQTKGHIPRRGGCENRIKTLDGTSCIQRTPHASRSKASPPHAWLIACWLHAQYYKGCTASRYTPVLTFQVTWGNNSGCLSKIL